MTGDSKLFLIDTNIVVYAYDEEDIIKHTKSKELLKQVFNNKIKIAISNQNLAEFVYVTTRKIKLDSTQTKEIINDIIIHKSFKKINYSTRTIISAIDILNEFKMPFWDSLLAATMRENGIFNIYTENAKDFKMPWINAVNPLK